MIGHYRKTSIMKPSDFYFAVFSEDRDCSHVLIVSKEFWNANECIDDQTPAISHLLPQDFEEATDSTWVVERFVDEVRSDLLALGFEESEDVKRFLTCYDE